MNVFVEQLLATRQLLSTNLDERVFGERRVQEQSYLTPGPSAETQVSGSCMKTDPTTVRRHSRVCTVLCCTQLGRECSRQLGRVNGNWFTVGPLFLASVSINVSILTWRITVSFPPPVSTILVRCGVVPHQLLHRVGSS